MQRTLVGSDGPERLSQIDFFSELTEAQCRMLARLVDELVAEPGDVLMDEGDFGYEVIFIESGTAEIRQAGEQINTVGAGELVGELAVVGGDGRRTASVAASSPLRALSLTSRAVHEIERRMPDVADAIQRTAAAHRERDRLRRLA